MRISWPFLGDRRDGNSFMEEREVVMQYGGVALPATGGGLVVLGLAAVYFQGWIIAVCALLLAVAVFGFWRLWKGEKELKDH